MDLSVRMNGFQRPYSTFQIVSVIIYPLVSAGYYIIINIDFVATWRPHVIWSHALLMSLVFGNWYMIEIHDPGQEITTLIPPECIPIKRTSRYCGTCRKKIVSMDHHCVWLNTCVSKGNYTHFFAIILCGLLQMTLQIVITVWLLLNYQKDGLRTKINEQIGSLEPLYPIFVSVHTILAGLLASSFFSLVMFHTYLIFVVRMGTYDWMLYRRASVSDIADDKFGNIEDDKFNDMEEHRQREREEFQRTMELAAMNRRYTVSGIAEQPSAIK